MRRNAVLAGGAAAVLVAAGAGWIGGRQIQSPSDVASKTAPPAPSLIVAPVEKRALASEVVVRGTVRYGAPQAVALATSALKKSSDIVTSPATKGAELREGDVAMASSGRPVFVLRGEVVADDCYHAHFCEKARRQRKMRGCSAQYIFHAPRGRGDVIECHRTNDEYAHAWM